MNTQETKQARQRRLNATARAREREREIGQEQAERKAAAAALQVPQARAAAARAQEQPTYLMGTYVHRVTGSRIKLMDTKAPDGPRRALAPEITPDGTTLRYATECLDHGTGPLFFATLKEAERAVRQSPTWCAECKQLLDTSPKVRGRNRKRATDPEPNGQIARSRPAQ